MHSCCGETASTPKCGRGSRANAKRSRPRRRNSGLQAYRSWLHRQPMRRIQNLTVLIAVATCSPAQAQQVPLVELNSNDAATLVFESGRLAGTVRGHAEWNSFELAVARQLAGRMPPDAPVGAEPLRNDGSLPERPPVHDGAVRLRFHAIADRHAMLVIENGYDQALVYRARITLNGQTRATDVCLVPPHQLSFEHWAEPIERLDLTDFRFVAWTPGQRPTCE